MITYIYIYMCVCVVCVKRIGRRGERRDLQSREIIHCYSGINLVNMRVPIFIMHCPRFLLECMK